MRAHQVMATRKAAFHLSVYGPFHLVNSRESPLKSERTMQPFKSDTASISAKTAASRQRFVNGSRSENRSRCGGRQRHCQDRRLVAVRAAARTKRNRPAEPLGMGIRAWSLDLLGLLPVRVVSRPAECRGRTRRRRRPEREKIVTGKSTEAILRGAKQQKSAMTVARSTSKLQKLQSVVKKFLSFWGMQ